MTSSPTRIVLADDHAFYREGVKAMLAAADAPVEVAGEAATGAEAIEQTLALQPDVVVMDLAMPGMSGLEATRRILAEQPGIAVLVLTMADDDSVFAAIRAGARGYLLKDASIDELVRAVVAVRDGQAIFSPSSAGRVLDAVAGRHGPSAAQPFPDLTERERDVLALLTVGRSNAEIAAELQLTLKTVRNYVSAVLVKLGARDRTQAVVRARDAGFPG